MGTAKQFDFPIKKVRLDRGENYLRALIDASDDGIIGYDLHGTVLSWNKGAEKIYGYKAQGDPRRIDIGVDTSRPPNRVSREHGPVAAGRAYREI
jgi:PAS domain-containing protein